MRIHMSPNSISQYKKDPDKGSWYISEQPHPGSSHMIKHKVRVVGIVEKGTIIQCTKLTKRTTWVLGHGFNTRVTPYALITSGSFSKTTVNILRFSAIDLEKSSDTVLFTPAPFVLAKEAI